jgi:hypothetical protein
MKVPFNLTNLLVLVYLVLKVSSIPSYNIEIVAGTGFPSSTGDGGPATAANINSAYGVWQNSEGIIFIVDVFGNRVRSISKSGYISNYAGSESGSASLDPTATNGDNGLVLHLMNRQLL